MSAVQEEEQIGKALDIGGAVNTMMMHLARANLAGTIQKIAVSAMSMQHKLEIEHARHQQKQQ